MHIGFRPGDELRLSGLQLPEDRLPARSASANTLLSVSQLATFRNSLLEDIAAWSMAGIHSIGLFRPKVAESEEEWTIELICESQVGVSSLNWIGGFTGCDGSRHAEAVFDACEAVRFAGAVGAGTVCAITGARGNHIGSHAQRIVVDALREVCDAAGEQGMRISLHAPSGMLRPLSLAKRLDEQCGLIARVKRDNLGLVFDAFEWGGDLDVLANLSEWMHFVHLVKLADRRNRGEDQRRPLGEGSLPLGILVRTLRAAGYAGLFEVDPWNENGRRSDYCRLLGETRQQFDRLLVEEPDHTNLNFFNE